ncbi:MAG: SRPBCC domain-containing protein [Actinobacteria bacterium]|nr:SRPBCC domain-containing protein [Actinomycetota bacterium]
MKELGTGPIVETVFLDAEPDAVYALVVDGIGDWWPLPPVSASGVEVDGLAFVDDELVERWADGSAHHWADVVAREPGRSLSLSWNPGGGAVPPTSVVIDLVGVAGGTQVRVTHDGWEPLGEEARLDYSAGWPFVLDRLALAARP